MKATVAVSGASGRLGEVVCAVVTAHTDFDLIAQVGRDADEGLGADADIWVDVSHPDASEAIVSRAVARGQKVIIGTSGWSEARLEQLAAKIDAAPGSAVLVVPNFSLGSVLGTVLARIAAPYFDAIEIVESHHPQKVDSPSGTAVRTAELMAQARGDHPVAAPFAEQPARGQMVAGIPIHSVRLQGVVARQEVMFGGSGEVLTVRHDTHTSESYSAGIRAALEAMPSASGLTVGLDRILGVGMLSQPDAAPNVLSETGEGRA